MLTPVADLPTDVLQFLLPSRYVPSDELGEQAHAIVKGAAPGYGAYPSRWGYPRRRVIQEEEGGPPGPPGPGY